MKEYPTTRDEWWAFVSKYEQDLLNIISRFVPHKMEDAKQYIADKNPEFSNILSDAWYYAPDYQIIHSIPSWGILCNLCSEAWVLHDEE
jgi:hypothetical protein